MKNISDLMKRNGEGAQVFWLNTRGSEQCALGAALLLLPLVIFLL